MRSLGPGAVFAGLRIEAEAGRGGMGIVYRAVDPALDRRVALKVIDPARIDDTGARRFAQEARAAAAIEHPNVVPIHASGVDGGTAYLVMRFVSGEDLRRRVRRTGPLEAGEAVRMIRQVAAALDAAHGHGIVHRDVKPANVLLAEGGHVYLTDFGIARGAAMATVTANGAWVGSSDFVAPEQIRGKAVVAGTDVYALGAVLFYALTGRPPFLRDGEEARLWAHLHAVPPAPSRHGATRALDAVVARALAKDAGERYATAGQLAEAASQALAGPQKGRLRARRRPRAPGAAAAGSPSGARAPGVTARGPAGRRIGVRVPLGLGLFAAGIAVGAEVFAGDDRRPEPRPPAPASAQIAGTPKPPGPVKEVARVRPRPMAVHASGSGVWVAGSGWRRLARLSTADFRRVRWGPDVGYGVSDLAEARGTLWVPVRSRRAVLRLRATTGEPVGAPVTVAGAPRAIDAGAGAVWVAELGDAADRLLRIDPRTGRITGTLEVPEGIRDVRAAGRSVWLLTRHADLVIRIGAGDLRERARVDMGSRSLRLDVAAGYVWVTNEIAGSVMRIDPRDNSTIPTGVGNRPYGIDAGSDDVWVACHGEHKLVRIDARTGRRIDPAIEVGLSPIAVQAVGRTVLATSADGSVARITLPARAPARAG